MKLEFFEASKKNFGDDLNPWLWSQLLPNLTDSQSNGVFVGIGTLLRQELVDKYSREAVHVFSSGAWLDRDATYPSNWSFHVVRGKLTAKHVGASNATLGDGAYLLAKMQLPEPIQMPDICFMPHHESLDLFSWESFCQENNIGFISPRDDVDIILAKMRGCKKIIAEAMHGAIVADALRIPWCAVRFSPGFETPKWHDFASAVNLELNIHDIPFVVNRRKFSVKTLLKSIKGVFGCNGIGPKKWQKQPWQWFSSREKYKDLTEKINKLQQSDNFLLSTNESHQCVVDGLFAALQEFKKAHLQS